MVSVPVQTSPAAGWELVDYVTDSVDGVITASGAAVITFPTVDVGQLWQVTRLVVSCSPAGTGTPPQVRVYTGTDSSVAGVQRALRSGTNNGNYDEADYPGDGLWVAESEQLIAAWSGAPVGARVVAAAQYRLLERSS